MDSQLLFAISIVTIIVGIVTSQGLLSWLGLMLLLVERIAHYWAQYALTDISYHREFSARRVFVGDDLTVTEVIENDKPLPVPWLNLSEDVSHAFENNPYLTRRYGMNSDVITHAFHLRWFERVRRKVILRPYRRGVHQFGPVSLTAGDPFGFHSTQRVLTEQDEVVVYPALMPLDTWNVSETALIGTLSSRRFLVDDPLNVVASREYQPGDPLRNINWKATARRGQLMTRVLEPTTEGTAAIVLNVRTYDNVWEGSDYGLVEECISIAASLASKLNDHDIPFSFHTNGFVTAGTENQVAAGRGSGHLADVLGVLARVNSFTRVEIGRLLHTFRGVLDPTHTVLLITPRLDPDIVTALDQLHRYGVRVETLLVREVPQRNADIRTSKPIYEIVTREALASATSDVLGGESHASA